MSSALFALGWNERLQSAFSSYTAQGLEPSRVTREDRDRFTLESAAGESLAEVTGRFRHEARGRGDFPAVGDWVAARVHEAPRPETDSPGHASIHAVLPRASCFVRKLPGRTTDEQVLAANIDTALLVTAADRDWNLRRLERYLAAAWESGASAAVVINKADLSADAEALAAETSASLSVPAVAVSAETGEGLDQLERWLQPGRTLVLLGSSGVGKSTLTNALLAHAAQATGDVRAKDRRGRHTTTARELFVLPGGALLIDTPGLRQFQLWTGEEALEETFADVEELARQCRFHDCAHAAEPGCAVRAAAAEGSLAAERLESWHKLQRELRYLSLRQDGRLQQEQKRRWKAVTKSMRNSPAKQRARS